MTESPDAPVETSKNKERIPKRVLIADDHRDGVDSLSMLLKISGHQVQVAHNGTEAFELAQRVKPHIAVLDIGMPAVNGYQVAERTRAEAWG